MGETKKRIQSRRSISVNGETYERLKTFCEANKIAMSQVVELKVNDYLDGQIDSPPIR